MIENYLDASNEMCIQTDMQTFTSFVREIKVRYSSSRLQERSPLKKNNSKQTLTSFLTGDSEFFVKSKLPIHSNQITFPSSGNISSQNWQHQQFRSSWNAGKLSRVRKNIDLNKKKFEVRPRTAFPNNTTKKLQQSARPTISINNLIELSSLLTSKPLSVQHKNIKKYKKHSKSPNTKRNFIQSLATSSQNILDLTISSSKIPYVHKSNY